MSYYPLVLVNTHRLQDPIDYFQRNIPQFYTITYTTHPVLETTNTVHDAFKSRALEAKLKCIRKCTPEKHVCERFSKTGGMKSDYLLCEECFAHSSNTSLTPITPVKWLCNECLAKQETKSTVDSNPQEKPSSSVPPLAPLTATVDEKKSSPLPPTQAQSDQPSSTPVIHPEKTTTQVDKEPLSIYRIQHDKLVKIKEESIFETDEWEKVEQ